MKDADNQNGKNSQEQPQEQLVFTTPFGILEEDFMRTVAKGNYTADVHELGKLITQRKITINEAAVLFHVKEKTINFRNTHFRCKRRDIQRDLQMTQSRLCHAIKSLIEKSYLLEKADTDNYFYYALNPVTFGGVIVLRSKGEAVHRVNRSEKLQRGLISKRYTKTVLGQYQSGIALISKWYSETILSIGNYSDFEMLKYILLKYILLNCIQDAKAEACLKAFEEVRNPEYMIQNFCKLLQKQPENAMGIVQELLRAYREGTDGRNRPIQTNAVAYVITSWDQVKHYYQSIVFKADMSPEVVAARKEHYDAIQAYKIENNVVALKKAGA